MLSTRRDEGDWGNTVDNSGWQSSGWELHTDTVHDLVPFWIQGVRAAERGEEVRRLCDFLDSLEEERKAKTKTWGWGASNDVAHDGWGAVRADDDGQWGGAQTGWGADDGGWRETSHQHTEDNDGWGAAQNGWHHGNGAWGDTTGTWGDAGSRARNAAAKQKRNSHQGWGDSPRKPKKSADQKNEAGRGQDQRYHTAEIRDWPKIADGKWGPDPTSDEPMHPTDTTTGNSWGIYNADVWGPTENDSWGHLGDGLTVQHPKRGASHHKDWRTSRGEGWESRGQNAWTTSNGWAAAESNAWGADAGSWSQDAKRDKRMAGRAEAKSPLHWQSPTRHEAAALRQQDDSAAAPSHREGARSTPLAQQSAPTWSAFLKGDGGVSGASHRDVAHRRHQSSSTPQRFAASPRR